jgi:hypothetical protein
MKMVLCANVRLDLQCAENLDKERSKHWRTRHMEKFDALLNHACEEQADYVLLAGNIFGQMRVAESAVDHLFNEVRARSDVRMLLILPQAECKRISYRRDIPENLFMLDAGGLYTDDHVAIRIRENGADIQLDDNDTLQLRTSDNRWHIGVLDEEQVIPSFATSGFEESRNRTEGYAVLEWEENEITDYAVVPDETYVFCTEEIGLRPDDDEMRIEQLVRLIGEDCTENTFLRLTLSGTTMFGTVVNTFALERMLEQRVFSAEVFDHSMMDIDMTEFENDISLSSEFVRLAMQDDTLSESERNRMISYGWQALRGKEVSAE